jgi:hypothetical protein
MVVVVRHCEIAAENLISDAILWPAIYKVEHARLCDVVFPIAYVLEKCLAQLVFSANRRRQTVCGA